MMDSSAASIPASAPRRARSAREVAAERVASVDRHIAAGLDVRTACRRAAVSVPSYYRWRARARGGVGQAERIREMILSAAKTVFLRDGYGASLESIAEAAEVARQTVYNQFGGKEQLFAEVVQSVYQRMLAPIFVVDHRDDLISMLTELGRHLMRVALHPDSLALQRIAMGEYRDTPALMKVVHTLRASHAIPAAYRVSRGLFAPANARWCDRCGRPTAVRRSFFWLLGRPRPVPAVDRSRGGHAGTAGDEAAPVRRDFRARVRLLRQWRPYRCDAARATPDDRGEEAMTRPAVPYTILRRRKSAISSLAYPSSARIESVCSPIVGARARIATGVALNSTPGVTRVAGRGRPG